MALEHKGEFQVEIGFGLPLKTTADRLAYTPPQQGYQVYDTDLGKVFVYVNSVWEQLAGADGADGVNSKVSKAGDTMTGPLILSGDPTDPLGAATRGFVETQVTTSAALKLNLTGGTMSGDIAMGDNEITGLPAVPSATAATSVEYVDGLAVNYATAAQGLLAVSALQPGDSIDDLGDVDTSTAAPTNGQALVWDGTNFVPTDVSVDLTNYVTLDGVQTITGNKTLTDGITAHDNTINVGSTLIVNGGVAKLSTGPTSTPASSAELNLDPNYTTLKAGGASLAITNSEGGNEGALLRVPYVGGASNGLLDFQMFQDFILLSTIDSVNGDKGSIFTRDNEAYMKVEAGSNLSEVYVTASSVKNTVTVGANNTDLELAANKLTFTGNDGSELTVDGPTGEFTVTVASQNVATYASAGTGTLDFGVKATSPSTIGSDDDTTLVTKDYVDAQVGGIDTLEELNDVVITSADNGDFLRYNGSEWADHVLVAADLTDGATTFATFAQGALADSALQPGDSIDTLGDVDISTVAPTEGQALVWNATDSEFQPADVAVDLTNYVTLDGNQTITGTKQFITSDPSGAFIVNANAYVGIESGGFMQIKSGATQNILLTAHAAKAEIIMATNAIALNFIDSQILLEENNFTVDVNNVNLFNKTGTAELIIGGKPQAATSTIGSDDDKTLTTKDYVDAQVGSVDLSNYVTLDTAQSITATKTFVGTDATPNSIVISHDNGVSTDIAGTVDGEAGDLSIEASVFGKFAVGNARFQVFTDNVSMRSNNSDKIELIAGGVEGDPTLLINLGGSNFFTAIDDQVDATRNVGIFTKKIQSPATVSGDVNDTLTTKGYVDAAVTAAADSVTSTDDLSDVDSSTLTPVAGHVLIHDGTLFANRGLTASDVSGVATAAQGALADSAVQPGDATSTLTNNDAFVDLTTAQTVSGVKTFSDDLTAGANLTVAGDLTVSGTTTTVNTTNTDISDSIITLNKGEAGAGVTNPNQSGLQIDRGTLEDRFLIWSEANQAFGYAEDTGTQDGVVDVATFEAFALASDVEKSRHVESFDTADWATGTPNTLTVLQSVHGVGAAGDIFDVSVYDGSNLVSIEIEVNAAGDVILKTAGATFAGRVKISQ